MAEYTPLIRQTLFALVAGVLLCAAHSGASAHEVQKVAPTSASPLGVADNPDLAVIKAAPDFTLSDTADRMFSLSTLRGRVVLLSFIYTSCITACPLLMQRMALLQDSLKHAGLWDRSVSFVSITIDPDRDTEATLRAYAQSFEAVDPNWRFLREQTSRLRRVLANYDEWIRPLPDGDIDHPARVYLIDRKGNIREIYALAFFDERQVLIDMRTLAAEH